MLRERLVPSSHRYIAQIRQETRKLITIPSNGPRVGEIKLESTRAKIKLDTNLIQYPEGGISTIELQCGVTHRPIIF